MVIDQLERLFLSAQSSTPTGLRLPGVYRGDPRGLAAVVTGALGEDVPPDDRTWCGQQAPRTPLVFAYARAVFLVNGLLVKPPTVEASRIMCQLAHLYDEVSDMARWYSIRARFIAARTSLASETNQADPPASNPTPDGHPEEA